MREWKLIESKTVKANRSKALELASTHAALSESSIERRKDAAHVKKLVQIIRNDVALPFQWATVEFEGKKLRMNGQHSSAAILEVGQEIPDSLAFHIDHYEATSRSGMVELFRQFDQRWSSRNSADIAGAYQALVKEIAECNRKVMKAAAEGISWCLRAVDGEPHVPTGDDVYSLLHGERYLPFLLWLNGIFNYRREILKREVMAAIYKSYDASQSHADLFWRKLAHGPDAFSDDMEPGAVLVNELCRAYEDVEFRDKEFPQLSIYYKKSVKAWNAFCAGQRIATLKVAGKGKGWPEVARPGDPIEDAA
jgi:hypothetical protein